MPISNLTKLGLVGTVVTALCCFTPILVILFGTLGLSWLVGYLDYFFFPLLFSSLALRYMRFCVGDKAFNHALFF